MKTKRIIAMLTAIMLICLASVSAFALPTPRMVNTEIASATLSVSGTTGTCKLKVTGKTGTTDIEADMRVLDEDGNEVKAWTASTGSRTLSSSKTFTMKKGVSYTFEADVTVYRNGTAESVSLSDSATA